MTTPRLAFTLILLAALVACGSPRAQAESEHTTVAAAEFRPDVRELQVILRLDPEEFEAALAEFTHEPMNLQNPSAERAAMLLLRSVLQMMDDDGVVLNLDWVGMQAEPAWVYIIVQFAIPRKSDALQISNRIYFSRHEDQENTLNIKAGGKETTLTFTKDNPWRTVSLPNAPEEGLTPIAEIVTEGHGPIEMVLIPTHSSDASMYGSFMERNADRYTMHAITLPGIAGTRAPPPPLPADVTPWIDNAVAATAHVIGDLGVSRPVVVGAGLGGIVAYRLAIEHPDLVGPVITLDAPPAMMLTKGPLPLAERRKMVDKVMKVQMSNATDEQWEAQLRKLAASIVVHEDRRTELVQMFLRTAPGVGKQYLLEHMRVDLAERMPEIHSPVLAIAALNNLGAPAGITPLDIKQMWESELAAAMREAPGRFRVVYFEDTGQFITEERPKKLDETVATFLGDVE